MRAPGRHLRSSRESLCCDHVQAWRAVTQPLRFVVLGRLVNRFAALATDADQAGALIEWLRLVGARATVNNGLAAAMAADRLLMLALTGITTRPIG